GRRSGAEPVYPWDRLPAHPKLAMMIIKSLQTDRGPFWFSETFSSARAAAAERVVRPAEGHTVVRAELYPIADCPTGRLAIMPRPRAGDWLDDEAASWRRHGLGLVVSLLEDAE